MNGTTTHLGTALIVGAGRGLGVALGRSFARAGHPVALLARNPDKLDALVAELSADGHQVRGYQTDAAEPDMLRGALRVAVSDLGPADVMVYNSALLRSDTPVDGDDEGWANAMAVDVLGAKVAAETVLPLLRDGRGSLLFTGGGLAINPSPTFASVSVGKAALRAYVQALHAHLRGSGVHATSVTISGSIGGGDKRFDPNVLAGAYLALHHEPAEAWFDELPRY